MVEAHDGGRHRELQSAGGAGATLCCHTCPRKAILLLQANPRCTPDSVSHIHSFIHSSEIHTLEHHSKSTPPPKYRLKYIYSHVSLYSSSHLLSAYTHKHSHTCVHPTGSNTGHQMHMPTLGPLHNLSPHAVSCTCLLIPVSTSVWPGTLFAI